MIKESKSFSKIIETEFNNLLAMTKNDDENFKNHTEIKVKVKDHDHITENVI